MRSGELARLAGVSVRALRHYHQVGVLHEPARNSSGYRGYDVHDLVRVLRIRRLGALGIPLERMPALLDDADHDSGALLDELDAELAAQMERLAGQRRIIAQLRNHGAAPDLPPELAPFVALYAAARASPELTRIDRDQWILLAHAAGETAMPQLTRFYERISDPALLPALTALVEDFDRLSADGSDGEADALTERFVDALAPVIAEFSDGESVIDLGDSASLLDEHSRSSLNSRQLRVLDRLARRFADPQE